MLALRYLVPATGEGFRGVVALLGQRNPLWLGIALYFVFSAVARHWRMRIVGTQEAAPGVGPVQDGSRRRREALIFSGLVAVAATAAYGIRELIVRPYRVLGASMLPTLEPNDLIAGRMRPYTSATAHRPSRADVVVFQSAAVALDAGSSALPDLLVKRVLGLPGDRIAMRGSQPVINGWPVPSCDVGDYLFALPAPGDRGIHGRLHVEFLEERAYLTVYSATAPFPDTYVVPPGAVFVLGDNRGNSFDSRAYNGGRGGGVAVDALDARVDRFLLGTHRNGDSDFGRLFRPVDRLQLQLRLEAVDTQALDAGITRCLEGRPRDTRPPSP